MKELSIEEKAKRYDEAIEQLRAMMPNWENLSYNGKTFLQDLVHIIPELKESEDEKWIPKEIAKYLKEKGGFRSCWLAWLEKQGNNMGISESTKKKLEDNLNKALEKETPKSCNEFLDWQGEQKLYVNDKAKEMFIKALECVEEQNAKGYKLTDCDKNSWWEDFKAYTYCTIEQKSVIKMKTPEESLGIDSDTYNKIVDECVYGEQNPAWSEEDETTKNNISHIIRQYDKISKKENQPCWYVGDCLLWMQNIKDRVQPKPKQEWSGGDEAHLHSLITHLEQWIERHPNTTGADIQGENITWLKSLKERYAWEPSEEQMDALHYATFFDYGGHKATLVSLYEQLKKLK